MSSNPPGEEPPVQNPYVPPSAHSHMGPPGQGDATGGLIPYKNAPALMAYYTGVFSLLCCPLGIVAIVLGVMGLRKAAQEPAVKGRAHAWVGIVLGVIEVIVTVMIVVLTAIGVLS